MLGHRMQPECARRETQLPVQFLSVGSLPLYLTEYLARRARACLTVTL